MAGEVGVVVSQNPAATMTYDSQHEAYDQNAADLPLYLTRGDDFDFEFDMVVDHPNPYIAGEILTVPVDTFGLSFDSCVEDNNGTQVATFMVTPSPDEPNRVKLSLSALETAALMPGTYTFWVDYIHTDPGPDMGRRRTIIDSRFTVRHKGNL